MLLRILMRDRHCVLMCVLVLGICSELLTLIRHIMHQLQWHSYIHSVSGRLTVFLMLYMVILFACCYLGYISCHVV